MKKLSEDILVQASRGDVGSFELIYKAHCGFVYRVALRMTNNIQDAEEITQEVFLTVYRKLKKFCFESSFDTWVYRIALNSTINYLKKMSKERKKMVQYQDELKQANGFSQERKIMSKHYHEKVISSLLTLLNPDQRMCIVLRSMEGLSYEEIAKTLKIKINTVRSRIKRGREILLTFKEEVVRDEL